MHRPTLLYAEDDLETRENYVFVLKRFFETIYTASDGEEALCVYREKRPDMLLLDISMPLLDGLSLAEKIRETDKEIPIVMLTAYSDQAKLLKAIPLGLTEYLLKPIDDRELLATMKKLVIMLRDRSCVYLKSSCLWYREDEEFFFKEKQIALTKKERVLMRVLSLSLGHYVSKEMLIPEIWQDESEDESHENKLIQLVYRFNKKIALETGVEEHFIENSYALGYRLLPS